MTRSEFLATVAPAERSEAAARWDHQIEADELRAGQPITEEERLTHREALIVSRVAWLISERGTYRDGLDRYLSGRILSAGLAREIARFRREVEAPTEEEVYHSILEERDRRLRYLISRYGVR